VSVVGVTVAGIRAVVGSIAAGWGAPDRSGSDWRGGHVAAPVGSLRVGRPVGPGGRCGVDPWIDVARITRKDWDPDVETARPDQDPKDSHVWTSHFRYVLR
jgi:hypothetical protein